MYRESVVGGGISGFGVFCSGLDMDGRGGRKGEREGCGRGGGGRWVGGKRKGPERNKSKFWSNIIISDTFFPWQKFQYVLSSF